MGYAFDYRSDLGKQVRRIARDQLESAIDLIEEGGDFDATVHALRRRCKKVRGLLRLVRPNFPRFAAENAHFRKAADSLSATRDAAVMVETFGKALEEPWAAAIGSADRSRLRRALARNVEDAAAGQDGPRLLAEFAASIDAALSRIGGWSFKGDGFSLVAPGLRDTYSRLRKGLERSAKSGEAEDFHDWRKDAKYHWFHVSLLRPSAPEVLGGRRAHLDRLGKVLGDHHNLAVLAQTLKTLVPDAPQPLFEGLEGQQARLADEAFALGRQLLVETPGQMTRRFGQFWKLLPEDK